MNRTSYDNLGKIGIRQESMGWCIYWRDMKNEEKTMLFYFGDTTDIDVINTKKTEALSYKERMERLLLAYKNATQLIDEEVEAEVEADIQIY